MLYLWFHLPPRHVEKLPTLRRKIMNKKYCLTCGSLLGVDCGDAEPDYDEHYCSEGCYKEKDYGL